MARPATEPAATMAASVRKRRLVSIRFFALDGAMCVEIEADSEEDARFLCRDQRLEFICLCD